MAISLALVFAAMPLRIFAVENCDCLASNSVGPVACAEQDAVSSCCVADDTERESKGPGHERDDEPCDGCDCPLACCGISKTLAAISVGVRNSPPRLACERSERSPLAIRGSPHISRLTRPPRPLTFAA